MMMTIKGYLLRLTDKCHRQRCREICSLQVEIFDKKSSAAQMDATLRGGPCG